MAWVYPRVCGGNRGRGRRRGRRPGLSPRVRGKPAATPTANASLRSIPACAGETGNGAESGCGGEVYPRVCGGNRAGGVRLGYAAGLSPRVRGKRQIIQRGGFWRRSIPACAGETPATLPTMRQIKVYPRVCGGNTTMRCWPMPTPGLSPRVRGKPSSPMLSLLLGRSIPACAGETILRAVFPPARWVYPRVCGGNTSHNPPAPSGGGLSPRVRGKRNYGIRPSQD